MLTTSVLRLAAAQHGVVSRTQLIDDLGISSSALSRARRAGTVAEVVAGVFRPVSSPETFEMRAAAVQLRSASIGMLSGWSAGRLHGLRSMPTTTIHFTVPETFRVSMPTWVDLHRSRWYSDEDRTTCPGGFLTATPLRTLFGLAAAFNQHRFERAAEDAWHRGLITPEAAAIYLEAHRCRGKDGVVRFETWLERALGRSRPTQSGLERLLLEALEEVGLPLPVRQHPLTLPSGEVAHLDIAWPILRLAIEPGDSWWHGGDAGQRRDQDRDRACAELGWLIVRFDETMRRDPTGSAHQVRRIYDRRATEHRNLT